MTFWFTYFLMGLVTFIVVHIYAESDPDDIDEDDFQTMMRFHLDPKFLWTVIAAAFLAWPIVIVSILIKGRK